MYYFFSSIWNAGFVRASCFVVLLGKVDLHSIFQMYCGSESTGVFRFVLFDIHTSINRATYARYGCPGIDVSQYTPVHQYQYSFIYIQH